MVLTETDTLEDIDEALANAVQTRDRIRLLLRDNARRLDSLDDDIAALIDRRCELA